MSEFKQATIRFRLEHRKVVPGQFPGLLFPEDGWGHPIGADRHPEQDRASHLWALLRHQDKHPQHQKSSAGRVLHAGAWKKPPQKNTSVQMNSPPCKSTESAASLLFVDCPRRGRIWKLPHSDTQAHGPRSPALQLRGSVTQAGAARMGSFPQLQPFRGQLHENSLWNFPSSVSQFIFSFRFLRTSWLEFSSSGLWCTDKHVFWFVLF